jgi:hypothetical protein
MVNFLKCLALVTNVGVLVCLIAVSVDVGMANRRQDTLAREFEIRIAELEVRVGEYEVQSTSTGAE